MFTDQQTEANNAWYIGLGDELYYFWVSLRSLAV